MIGEHKEVTQDRLYYYRRQSINVQDFEANGCILDIGGGGEGVIGRMKGRSVVAIDTSRLELEEAPAGPLKIIMDARSLKFLDNSFETATAFFSFMYICDADYGRVFSEVFRILAPGGRFLIWDALLPVCPDPARDIAAIPMLIQLPDQDEITAGYGTPFPEQEHNLEYFTAAAAQAGFEVISHDVQDIVFYLELEKPIGAGEG